MLSRRFPRRGTRRGEDADAFANQPAMVRAVRTPGQFAYLLCCGDGTLYAGYTLDPARRLAAHRTGRAARYTRGRGPWTFAALWRCPSRSSALALERLLKRIGRRRRLALAAGGRLSLIVPEAGALRARRVSPSALAGAGRRPPSPYAVRVTRAPQTASASPSRL